MCERAAEEPGLKNENEDVDIIFHLYGHANRVYCLKGPPFGA